LGILHRKESVLPARISVPLMQLVQDTGAMANIGRAVNPNAVAAAPRMTESLVSSIREVIEHSVDVRVAANGAAGRDQHFHIGAPKISTMDAKGVEAFYRNPSTRRIHEKLIKAAIRRGKFK
jgi:hypothetical protein